MKTSVNRNKYSGWEWLARRKWSKDNKVIRKIEHGNLISEIYQIITSRRGRRMGMSRSRQNEVILLSEVSCFFRFLSQPHWADWWLWESNKKKKFNDSKINALNLFFV